MHVESMHGDILNENRLNMYFSQCVKLVEWTKSLPDTLAALETHHNTGHTNI